VNFLKKVQSKTLTKTARMRGFKIFILKFLVKLFSKSLRGLGQRPKVLLLTFIGFDLYSF